jgi:hypothetical protein
MQAKKPTKWPTRYPEKPHFRSEITANHPTFFRLLSRGSRVRIAAGAPLPQKEGAFQPNSTELKCTFGFFDIPV